MAKDDNPSLALRVTVQSGGCHGFQYLMSLTNSTKISAEEDTVFEASDGTGAKVVMDEPSLELLKGSQVDFTMELIGSQFKIVGNPAATKVEKEDGRSERVVGNEERIEEYLVQSWVELEKFVRQLQEHNHESLQD
ncbi:hypothetical protein MMC32_002080 [Xylographa parallela]|nr:hypothetical protein [Xylographa parallela]